ncbi:MAG: GNAT family N-acetyltransferase [Actinobacteria bacterium]|uniref:Unannotated protein n=1 Tax=freshwater metagenome TaxID=449393 RepID=A0A6J5YKF1_9ZZZZ|nr:GNAT family N-acetyltransferase [Actinomycetota bacterium]
MALSIRPVSILDIDDLVRLVEGYRAFYKQEPNTQTKEYLVDRILGGQVVAFIAQLESRAIGFTMIYPTYSTVSLTRIWLLNDLFVDFNYRGQGIANALVQAAETAAKEAGASRIWLRTAEDNVIAQRLYESRGWVQDKVFRRYDLIF